MTGDTIRHRLSFAVTFIDHFSREPVPAELPVRLAGSFHRPALEPGRRSRRQGDGTYRFTDAPPGAQQILWREPLNRTQAGWARWDDADLAIMLPLPNPATLASFELWPTADAALPKGTTGVRGKLVGADNGGMEVRIARTGQPFGRFTRSDDYGEFLFPLVGRLPLNAARRISLTIELGDPDFDRHGVAEVDRARSRSRFADPAAQSGRCPEDRSSRHPQAQASRLPTSKLSPAQSLASGSN